MIRIAVTANPDKPRQCRPAVGSASCVDGPSGARGKDRWCRLRSGAVMCPACWRGAYGRWPWWSPRIGSQSVCRAWSAWDTAGLSDPRLDRFVITSHHPCIPLGWRTDARW